MKMLLTMDYFLIFFLSFIIVLVIAIASFLIFRHVKCCCRRPRKKEEESITYAPNPMFYGNMNLRRFGNLQQGKTQGEPPKPMGTGFYTAPPTLSPDHFQVTGEPMFFSNNIQPTPSAEWVWGYLYGLQAAEDTEENCFNNQCTVYTMSSATNTWPAVHVVHGAQTNFDVMVAANTANAVAQQAGSESADVGDAAPDAGSHSCADGSHDAGSGADCVF